MVDVSSSAASSVMRYRAAGFWRRFFSGFLDLLILSPLLLIFFLGFCIFFHSPFPKTKELIPDLFISYLIEQKIVAKAFLLLVVIILFLYHFLFHSLMGCTLGDRLMKMRVIDSYGQRPGFLRVLIRTLGMGVSFILAGAGFLWIAFDRERRALHDWVGGTYVVLIPTEKKVQKT